MKSARQRRVDVTVRITTLRLFASAVVAAMFVGPGTTSGSNFTARADQPVKLAQNKCTPAHQRLCREHHDECLKKSGSTQYGCCISYSTCLNSRVLSKLNMQEMRRIKSGRMILVDARRPSRLKIRHRLFAARCVAAIID